MKGDFNFFMVTPHIPECLCGLKWFISDDADTFLVSRCARTLGRTQPTDDIAKSQNLILRPH
jgi:hypothetical protein